MCSASGNLKFIIETVRKWHLAICLTITMYWMEWSSCAVIIFIEYIKFEYCFHQHNIVENCKAIVLGLITNCSRCTVSFHQVWTVVGERNKMALSFPYNIQGAIQPIGAMLVTAFPSFSFPPFVSLWAIFVHMPINVLVILLPSTYTRSN